MFGPSRVLTVIFSFLFVLLDQSARAQHCPVLDPTASKPLTPVALPPKEKCLIRLRNGFPIPDPACTPGAVNQTVNVKDLYDAGYEERCSINNNLSVGDRASTYAWYNIVQPTNNTGEGQTCEVDHLIPLKLGGADSLNNIWPICGPPGAELRQRYFKQKSLVEVFLAAEVKAGRMELRKAQEKIAEDWTQFLDLVWAIAGIQGRVTSGLNTTPRLPSKENDAHLVDMLIATTRGIERVPNPTDTQLELIPNERREQLSFGAAKIRVPADDNHKIGQVERPKQWVFFGITLYREKEDEKKFFALKSTRWLSQTDFIESVNKIDSNEALIFIHGFNTRFEDGLFRLAQIVWDTQFNGVPILFSWPSKGGVLAYEFDRESAEYSEPGFRQLIQLLQYDTKLSKIHVIAHSMGNLIAVQTLANFTPDTRKNPFGQLLLAAPDIDRDLFKILEPKISGFRGITLYASSSDKALQLSHQIAQGFRAGDVPSAPDNPVLLPNMDTIDVTAIGSEIFGLNHNTFASSRSAIDDIGRLLRTGERPPNLRTPQIRSVPLAGLPLFWRYSR